MHEVIAIAVPVRTWRRLLDYCELNQPLAAPTASRNLLEMFQPALQ